MEILTDILARTGKATVRELAAIVKIDSADALNMLRELQEEGAVHRDGMYWSLPAETESLPAEIESVPVSANAAPESTSAEPDITIPAPTANQTPLKVIWSAPEDFQVFPTRAWVRQQRRALQQEEREFNRAMKNKKRTLAQIDNLVRRVTQIQSGVARIEGQA